MNAKEIFEWMHINQGLTFLFLIISIWFIIGLIETFYNFILDALKIIFKKKENNDNENR